MMNKNEEYKTIANACKFYRKHYGRDLTTDEVDLIVDKFNYNKARLFAEINLMKRKGEHSMKRDGKEYDDSQIKVIMICNYTQKDDDEYGVSMKYAKLLDKITEKFELVVVKMTQSMSEKEHEKIDKAKHSLVMETYSKKGLNPVDFMMEVEEFIMSRSGVEFFIVKKDVNQYQIALRLEV